MKYSGALFVKLVIYGCLVISMGSFAQTYSQKEIPLDRKTNSSGPNQIKSYSSSEVKKAKITWQKRARVDKATESDLILELPDGKKFVLDTGYPNDWSTEAGKFQRQKQMEQAKKLADLWLTHVVNENGDLSIHYNRELPSYASAEINQVKGVSSSIAKLPSVQGDSFEKLMSVLMAYQTKLRECQNRNPVAEEGSVGH